jgi:hypothetical protein
MPGDPPRKIEPPKVVPPPPPKYDQFGNQIGDIGLGQQNEFKGQRILFWGGHTAFGKVYFSPSNPMWSALEDKGFAVRREFGEFKTEWLNSADQLWILSSSSQEIPPGTDGMLDELVRQMVARNPPGKRPFGWSDKNLQLALRTELDVDLSPKFPLDDDAISAVEKFIKAGKGVCLLADNDPFVVEANELASRLYGVNVSGDYPGQKIAYVRQRELPEDVIRKFRGAYVVDDHPLLTGVNFVYEGITISNVGRSEQLEVAMKASDGKPLLAVSKVPGQRVVIDCGYTRYCHGSNDETSFIMKTAGTLRLAQNIAAYLAGKVAAKKP